jgi:AraC family transcriptional regulator
MRHASLPGPDGLFAVSRQPRFLSDSNSVGWDGAFFTDIQAAQEGTVDHGHVRFCVQHSPVPFRARELRPGAPWTTMTPGLGIWHPGDEQRFDWQGGGSRQFLFVEPARVEQILGAPARPHRLRRHPHEMVVSPVASAILRALVCDLREGSPAGALVGDSLIAALLAHLWAMETDAGGSGGLPSMLRKRVLAYIDERLETRVTLADLADLARMSVRHFCRAFRASMGCSPHQYVLSQRVERAKQLIAAGRMPLCEIAQVSGFSDQSQFTRTFQRQAGVTPAAYRLRVS